MEMTLSIRFMLEHFERLEMLGFSREQSIKAANLPKANYKDLDLRVPLRAMADVYSAAQTALNDSNIGLNSGFKFRVATYGKTGGIYGYCQNIPQAIQTNAKYQKVAIDAGEISYDPERDKSSGLIRHFMTFHPYMDDIESYRHVIDSIAGAYFTAYRWLGWSSGEDILHVDLPYAAPEDTSTHERLFECSISFNQPYLRLEFSEKTIVQDIATYDPEKFARAEAQLMALLESAELCDGLKMAVMTAMRASLENGKIGTIIIAERMDKTWSVLRRELSEANLSYRDLLEKVRKDMFLEYLEEDRSFSEIAQALCYNDQAAFTKAFNRWYGMSPRDWKTARQTGKVKGAKAKVLH